LLLALARCFSKRRRPLVTTVTFFPKLCYTRHLKVEASSRIITLGCDLAPFDLSGTAVESWNDVPLASQDLPGAWSAIRAHVQQLVAQIEQRA
jgi:hypothetical protein